MNDHADILSLDALEDRIARIPDLDADALEAEQVALLGRKSGLVTALLRRIPELPAAERRPFGARVNLLKERIETAIAGRREILRAAREVLAPPVDLSLPARRRWIGGLHPVTLVVHRVVGIFRELGFTVATGPEVETEWYNFLSLNFPPDHPAMDMHDTLYLKVGQEHRGPTGPGGTGEGDRLLLRTHTSPVQIRVMQAGPPPYRVLIPGMVYRKDPFDPSHAPAFHQIEGLAVDEGVSLVDLKATLTHFAHRLFGPEREARFRPSYFPFTEPSAEMDLRCGSCDGAGCPVCKGTGWVEILGCGMVHPRVLENAGVDSERYTGWAFGMGSARMALASYGFPYLRMLYEGDMRVLSQFAGAL